MNAKIKAWIWDKVLAVLTVFGIIFALAFLMLIAAYAKQAAPNITTESSKHNYSVNIDF